MRLTNDVENRNRFPDHDRIGCQVFDLPSCTVDLRKHGRVVEAPGHLGVDDDIKTDRATQFLIDRIEVRADPIVLGKPDQAVMTEAGLKRTQNRQNDEQRGRLDERCRT